jgi:zinc D-Ala-D-Ala carboxypeptidase
MTQLSPHFTVEEFSQSQTAGRLGINNDLPIELYETAKRTAAGLEQVRLRLRSHPIHISSGYRCLSLNAAVGSKNTSQHVKAEAVDFTCPTFGSVGQIIEAIIDSDIEYDQLISEYASNGGGWVHISFSDTNKKQALVIDEHGARAYA